VVIVVPDALVVVSFGGPEGPDDVIPFLEHVLAGRGVPRARLEAVAEQYATVGGVSPINAQARALVAALEPLVDVPVLWGNRHAPPFLADTIAEATARGFRHLIAFATSAYAGVSSCRAYLDAIEAARATVGPDAPAVEKLPPFFAREGFVAPFADAVEAIADDEALIFTAHSIPVADAAVSDYEAQLRTTAALVARGRPWELVFQSRSGRPDQPWLGPDVNDHLADLAAAGVRAVLLCPIGFVSDHMEVVYDLDTKAAATAARVGISLRRTPTPGTDPRFVAMIAGDVNARVRGEAPPHPCAATCCRLPR
jgi:ferrochelatase